MIKELNYYEYSNLSKYFGEKVHPNTPDEKFGTKFRVN